MKIREIDERIIHGFYTPIAHWVDRRLWINNYKLASVFAYAGSFFVVFGTATKHFWGTTPGWFSWTVTILLSTIWLLGGNRMKRCGEQWEKNPTAIPKDAAAFQGHSQTEWLFLCCFLICLDISVMVHFGMHGEYLKLFLRFVFDLDWPSYTIALGFAAVMPYRGKRDSKKVYQIDISLQPAIQGVGA